MASSVDSMTRPVALTPKLTPAVGPVAARPLPAVKDGFDSVATKSAVNLNGVTPVPTTASGSDDPFDGKLLGANGEAYPPTTPIDQVPAVKPNNGKASSGVLTVFVNGISTTAQGQLADAQTIANATGDSVVDLHNATDGFWTDMGQSMNDYFNTGNNPAVDSLTQIIYSSVKAGKPLHLMAHSQGGLIVARALQNAEILLGKDGLSQAQVQQKMGIVGVETFASASPSFPDGPKYVHYVDDVDPVTLLGLHRPGAHPGAGAKVESFNTWNPFDAHGLSNYLGHWQPFTNFFPNQPADSTS